MKSELLQIPSVGPASARDFARIGITKIEQLKGQNPEELYERLNAALGKKQDRCVLYMYRCAVYYANTEIRDPEKLKWWNWKD